jgi:hypothetical protein
MTSSPLLNPEAEPETYDTETSKNPVSSVSEEIVNKAKSEESALFEILKWPLIVDVESSIVRKKAWISVALSSSSSIVMTVARDSVPLLNFTFPVPGSV